MPRRRSRSSSSDRSRSRSRSETPPRKSRDDLEDLPPIHRLLAKVQALKDEFPKKTKDQKETAQNQYPEAEANQKADQEVLPVDPDDKNAKEVDLDQETEIGTTEATVAVTVAAEAEPRPEKADHQKTIEEAEVGARATRKNHHQPEITMIADETNQVLELEGAEAEIITITEDREDQDQEATPGI